MKVSLAAQALSRRVAAVIEEFASSGRLPPEARNTAILLSKMDSIFDSVNGGFGGNSSSKILRRMVGSDTTHNKIWLEGKQLFGNMEFIPKNATDRPRPKCLKGWQRTLEGFCLIKAKLSKLGFKNFPARAFNQDPLENLFGQVRQYGVRYTNPSCKAFIPFYKSLLIRNFSSYHSRSSNYEVDNDALLVTLRDFLAPKPLESLSLEQHSGRDRWHPPSVPGDVDDLDEIDQHAVGYIGGFLIKSISPKRYECDTCQSNLLMEGLTG